MRKIGTVCLLALLCAMLAGSALAVEIVCVQPYAPGSDREYRVMQATLDNGQIVYYLSTDSEPRHTMEDVNFDGYEDFVPTISLGASNFFTVFFLYNPQTGQYEPVHTDGLGFCNYALHSEKGYVVSDENDGWRDGETKIYQWQESALKLLRSATVGTLCTVEFVDDAMVERWDFSQYVMTIYDYTGGEEGGQVIFQETYPEDDAEHDAHVALFEAKLWEGL